MDLSGLFHPSTTLRAGSYQYTQYNGLCGTQKMYLCNVGKDNSSCYRRQNAATPINSVDDLPLLACLFWHCKFSITVILDLTWCNLLAEIVKSASYKV